MGPGGLRAAALVISECQAGILDPAMSTMPALVPRPEDHVSRRATGITAFYGTDLDAVLRLRDVETIVVTGVSTDVAVPGLAIEAVNRGYYVEIPADCVAGTSAQSYEFMMGGLLPAVARITDSAALLAALAELPEGIDTC
jgi:nicotinamidase-related amidase